MISKQATLPKCVLFTGLLLIFPAILSCSDKVIGPQSVNIEPIKNLKFPKTLLTLESLDGYKKTAENGMYVETKAKDAEGLVEAFEKEFRRDYPDHEYSVIWVGLELYRDLEKASKAFDRFASYLQLKPQGNNTDRHLVSQIIQPRTDPEGGYRLMKSFRSKLVFQKNNLLIYINESKSNLERDVNWKNEIIEEIANTLNRIEMVRNFGAK
jgi:hypothetical protein